MYKDIKKIVERDRATVDEYYLYISEEIGEIAQALLVDKKLKRRKLKEPAYSECVDVIVATLGLFIKLGGTEKEFNKIFKKKSGKWRKRVYNSIGDK